MRPCHNYFLSFHIQNKVFHFTPLTQYIIVSTGFGPARKYFSPNVFGGLVKIRDKLSLKIRD